MEKDQTPITVEGILDLCLRTQLEKSCPAKLVMQLKTQKVKSLQQMSDMADAHFTANGYHTRKQASKKPPSQGQPRSPQQLPKLQGQHYTAHHIRSSLHCIHHINRHSCRGRLSLRPHIDNSRVETTGWKGSAGQLKQQAAASLHQQGTESAHPTANYSSEQCIATGSLVTPQHSIWLAATQGLTSNGTCLMIQPGRVNGISAEVMRDNGSTGCCVWEEFVAPDCYTSGTVNVVMINGTQMSYLLAIVKVESPFYIGRVVAAVMKDSAADLVIGNIGGVRNFCFREATTQTGAVDDTRGAAKATGQVKPLLVSSVADLTNSEVLLLSRQLILC
ncbi:hypothetical protein E2C01_065861 [Portunus trituberculatus]|uniref:Uncharacterized protein n=1 Tax=Portunus trituberculatus TaxID=210409 RepID=A0A5B7HFQ2_PORTR|nr:hypothetical protein [Portunus trituberculatus]